MGHPSEHYAISVSITHFPDEQATQAEFLWPHAVAPRNTYTIDLTPDTSLELDTHYPSRPQSITLNDTEHKAHKIIGRIIGEDLTDAMIHARRMGMLLLDIEMDESRRLTIARKQLMSPSTPFALRHAISVFLQGRTNEQASTVAR